MIESMTQTADDMAGDMHTESAYDLTAEPAFELLGESWNELPVEPSTELPDDWLIELLSESPNADVGACSITAHRSARRAVAGSKTRAI
jgi:hypothetical protein